MKRISDNRVRHLKYGMLLIIGIVSTTTPLFGSRVFRILPLGNSITASARQMPSYRYYLWNMLKQAGYGERVDFVGTLFGVSEGDNVPPMIPCDQWDCDHEGHWGYTTGEILAELPGYLEHATPDIVLLHLGTNDIGQSVPFQTIMENFGAVIGTLRQNNPDVVVLLAQIIPAKINNHKIIHLNELIGGFGPAIATRQSPVVVVDMFSPFDPLSHLRDDVHPNSAGEWLLAETWFDSLRIILDDLIPATTIRMISPAHGSVVAPGVPVQCEAVVTPPGIFHDVKFFADSTCIGAAEPCNDSTWTLRWTPPENGYYRIRIQGRDNRDRLDYNEDFVGITVTDNPGAGCILAANWWPLQGMAIADLVNHPAFPDNPVDVLTLPHLAVPRDTCDRYGARIVGFIHPPETGNYLFSLSANETADLYLSPDDNPDNRTRISYVNWPMDYGDWDRVGATSSPVFLEQGRRYFIEVLHKEATGEDHCEVTWTLPDGTRECPVPGIRLSPLEGGIIDGGIAFDYEPSPLVGKQPVHTQSQSQPSVVTVVDLRGRTVTGLRQSLPCGRGIYITTTMDTHGELIRRRSLVTTSQPMVTK